MPLVVVVVVVVVARDTVPRIECNHEDVVRNNRENVRIYIIPCQISDKIRALA